MVLIPLLSSVINYYGTVHRNKSKRRRSHKHTHATGIQCITDRHELITNDKNT